MEQDSNVKLIKSKRRIDPLPPIKPPSFQKEEIHPSFQLNESTDSIIKPEACVDREVPVIKLSKTMTTVTLADRENKSSKKKLMDVIARGILKGANNLEIKLDGELHFRGNFKGTFEKEEQSNSNIT